MSVARVATLLSLALSAASLAGAVSPVPVLVTDTRGRPVAGAEVACTDPPGALALAGQGGNAWLDPGCRAAVCRAAGHLEAEVAFTERHGRCRLEPGLVLSGTLAGDRCPDCEARLFAAGADASAARAGIRPPAPDAPPRFEFPAVRPGRYRLEVAPRDGGWLCRTDLGPLGAGPVSVGAVWRAPVRLAGRVTDAKGKPIAGLPVRAGGGRVTREAERLAKRAAPEGWRCGPGRTETRTGKEGRFTIEIDPGIETLVAAGDWDAPAGVAATVVSGREPGALALVPERPARVTARVVDTGGAPVAATATIEPDDPDALWLTRLLGGDLDAETDERGRLALGPFRARRFTLRLTPDGALPVSRREPAPAPGATVDLGEIVVDRGAALEVLALDDTGAPIAEARVRARARSGIILREEARTGEDGRARITGLPRGALATVEVAARGYRMARLENVRVSDEPLEVRLGPGVSVAGRVETSWGEPIAGAVVTARGEQAADRVEADEEGLFEALGLAPGPVEVTAVAPGYTQEEPLALELEPGEHRDDLVLALEPAPSIEGRVVDPNGSGVAGAEVALIEGWAMAWGGLALAAARTTSGAGGAFELRAAAEPGARVVATAEGYGPAVVPAPIGDDTDETLELQLTEPARLRARLPSGAPQGAKVRVVDGSGLSRERWAGGETVVEIADLAPGPGSAALVPGPERPVTLVAGETVEVDLSLGATIEGRVTLSGAPLPRATVGLTATAEGRLQPGPAQISDAEGRFRFEGVAPGSYLLSAQSALGRAETRITVSGEERIAADLAIEPAVAVVRVTEAGGGGPIPGANVLLEPAGREGGCARSSMRSFSGQTGYELDVSSCGGGEGATAQDGVARIAVSEPGAYRLMVTASGYDSADEPVEVPIGETPFAIELSPKPRTGSIHARLVTDPAGLAGAFACQDPENVQAFWVAREATCEDLRPGRWAVLYRVPGVGTVRQEVDVAPGETAEVTLQPARGGRLIVPIEAPDAPRPVVRDAQGVDWSEILDGALGFAVKAVRKVSVPKVGEAWVFEDLPPGTYSVEVGGAARDPVTVPALGEAVAW